VLVAAEAAYIELVKARRAKDAAAATGERLGEAKARARQDSAAESDPQTSALRHGVDRVRVEDSSGLDTFIRQYTAGSGPTARPVGQFNNTCRGEHANMVIGVDSVTGRPAGRVASLDR
jgi:hypothetical protein